MYFPVTYSTLSDQALKEFISKHYDLEDITEVKYLLRGMNDTYLVLTAERKYVFRVYRGDWRREYAEVAFEMELLQFLKQRGISVSMPIEDAQGEIIHTLNAPEGKRFGVLFTYAEGAERDIDSQEISYVFGKAAAEIHLASDNFQSHYPRQKLDLNYLIHQSLAIIESGMQHRREDFEGLKNIAKQLEESLLKLSLAELDWGICHGDLHGNTNISYKDDMSYTHYDFDLCGLGWRAYDIAEFRLAREVRLGHDPQKLEELWDAFIQGYRSVRDLSEKDVKAVPIFVGIRQLWLMGLCLMDPHIVGGIDYGDDFIDEKLSYFNNLEVIMIPDPSL
ncbi:phosphotransferase [Paenibacillus sp. DMB20]|uniref:phosphotransferase n=1 Tax=Paenibacillus sp. DMB20 TaxID=1642570 RepID=UPI000627F39D|nr:phosphotransferase [Paenibacillus sp. DMB20]KKO51756.1 hypothetical protein XI25_23780 [Paenibacillus sp. DMB20]